MLTFKLLSLIVLMTCVLHAFGYPKDDMADPCLITRKCSTIEDIVWATDDYQCYLFRNPCIFGTDMCRRREEYKTDLKIVPKDKCKEKCSNYCTLQFAPICAEYNNALETFSNKCAFYSKSCKDEKSYIFLHSGACDETVAA